jgi:SepF-like predicted cell division protein (DUF552 family)
MSGRTRDVMVRFRVTEEEHALILEKMRLLGTENLAAYLRKMAIDGYIIVTDFAAVKEMTAQIQKVGVNVNQIAHRVNAGGTIYAADIEGIKEAQAEIWRLQRYILSKAR